MECPICLNEINNKECIVKTKCNHSFCKTCYEKNLKKNNKCSICRRIIYDLDKDYEFWIKEQMTL
jgi:hypothetical protein